MNNHNVNNFFYCDRVDLFYCDRESDLTNILLFLDEMLSSCDSNHKNDHPHLRGAACPSHRRKYS